MSLWFRWWINECDPDQPIRRGSIEMDHAEVELANRSGGSDALT